MDGIADLFLPSPRQVIGLGAVLVVALGFVGIGAAAGGRRRLAEADLVCGWGLACLYFTIAGVLSEVRFSVLALLAAAAAVAGLIAVYRRDGRVLVPGTGKVLALAAVLFLVVTGLSPSQWDEYSHWLPAGRYLFEIDTFPGAGYPPSVAEYPGYPHGVPLIAYLVSRVAGHFVENAGALFNVTFLLVFALVFIKLVRKGLSLPEGDSPGWGLAALGILGVTVFSTTFVQKVIFTAYADFPSAAALAFAGVSGWFLLEALAAGDRARARRLALQMGLALAALVNAKQANLVIFVFLLAGVGVAGWRDPRVKLGRLLAEAPLIVGPAVVIYAVWQIHVSGDLASGAQRVLPFAQWEFHIIPQTLVTMLKIMARKGAYFGLMAVITGFAVRALIRFEGRFDRLAIITATVFVGYNLFLLFAYFAIFGGYTGANALSYWRYNMHLGLLGAACIGFGGALLWKRLLGDRSAAGLATVAVALVLILPAVFAPKLRFDLRLPKQYVKKVGTEIAAMLPDGARVFVIDPLDTGFYAKMMRYQIYGVGRVVGRTDVYGRNSVASITAQLERTQPTHVWVHTQTPSAERVFGQPLARKHSHLLVRDGGGWKLLKSWPYPGYDLPQDVAD